MAIGNYEKPILKVPPTVLAIVKLKFFNLLPLKSIAFKKAQKYLINIYLMSDSHINAIINNNIKRICVAPSSPDIGTVI